MEQNLAQRRPSPDILPKTHGLWSLWEMLRPYAGEYIYVMRIVDRLVSAVSDHPLPPNFSKDLAKEYPRAASMLGPPPESQSHDEALRYVLRLVPLVSEDIPMPSVTAQHERILGMIGKRIQQDNLASAMIELGTRLADELEKTKFFYVRPEYVSFYSDPMLFGEKTNDSFPSAIDDISDAGKCLALAQGTAAVFHLMRIMEVGLRSLSRSLGIPYAPMACTRFG